MKVFSGSIGGSHSVIADDIASNTPYDDGVVAGDNGGYGFGDSGQTGWGISTNTTNGGAAGVFQGSVHSGFGDINTDGVSLGLYGKYQAQNGVDFTRTLPRALSVGFALSASIACRWRDGGKGLSLYNSTSFSTGEIFNLNISNSGYVVDSVNLEPTFADDMIIRCIFKQVGSNTFDWSLQFKSATPDTGSKTGSIRAFKFYNYGAPSDDNRNEMFINSFKVYRY